MFFFTVSWQLIGLIVSWTCNAWYIFAFSPYDVFLGCKDIQGCFKLTCSLYYVSGTWKIVYNFHDIHHRSSIAKYQHLSYTNMHGKVYQLMTLLEWLVLLSASMNHANKSFSGIEHLASPLLPVLSFSTSLSLSAIMKHGEHSAYDVAYIYLTSE